MSHPIDYHPKQLNEQRMGSQSNDTLAVALVVPNTVEVPGNNLVPQEVHPAQEALFGNRCIFVHAPQFYWRDYHQGAMDVDRDARDQIMELADRLYEIGCRTKAYKMELLG